MNASTEAFTQFPRVRPGSTEGSWTIPREKAERAPVKNRCIYIQENPTTADVKRLHEFFLFS
jgi:hypothetical protein